MIKQLTRDDVPDLMSLAQEMHFDSVYSNYPLDLRRVAANMELLIDHEQTLSIGYEIGGKLAGAFFGQVTLDLWVDVMVANDIIFYVGIAYRSTRAGVVLIKAFEDWSNNKGADVIRPVVYAGVNNDVAGSVLSRLGYRGAGTIFLKEAA